MEFSDEDNIKTTLLYHLRRKRKIGESHAPYDTIKKGLPSHLGKYVEKIARELIRIGWIITKPTSYGLQVSLNKDKLKEIEEFIQKVLGFTF